MVFCHVRKSSKRPEPLLKGGGGGWTTRYGNREIQTPPATLPQMPLTRNHFPLSCFTVSVSQPNLDPCKVVLTFQSMDEIRWFDYQNESKATEQNFQIIYNFQCNSQVVVFRYFAKGNLSFFLILADFGSISQVNCCCCKYMKQNN